MVKGRAVAPPGDHLHHWRLHLHEAAAVEVVADELHHLGTDTEGPPRILVHDQVDITLAVAQLLIRNAVKLLRQGPQRLGQQANTLDLDREFSSLGFEQHPLGADDVTDVPLLELGVVEPLFQGVALHEELHPTGHVLDVGEAGFAHHPAAHQAAGDAHPQAHRLQLFLALVVILGMEFTSHAVAPEVVGKGDGRSPAVWPVFPRPLGNELVFVLYLIVHRFIQTFYL